MEESDTAMNNASDNVPAQSNHWQEFWETLKERARTPCKHPTFVMYFVGIIIILGGLGLLEAVVSFVIFGKGQEIEWVRLISACYTYFLAIAATAAVDLILSLNQRKFLLMFFLLCCLAVVLCAIFAAIFGAFLGNAKAAAFPSVLGYVLALFLWWVGNATNPNLLEPVSPSAPTGGDAQANPAGNLSGFTV
jgi:hypothetical protein